MNRKLLHRPPVLRETDVQAAVKAFYTSLGMYVYATSDHRSGPSRNTPGIPDLLVLGRLGVILHETKTDSGKLSEEQLVFQQRCLAFGIPYVVGGREDAEDYLKLKGLLR